MRKKIIGMIADRNLLLLASCGSRGEVKRSGADGKQVLSGYITLSGAFAPLSAGDTVGRSGSSPSPRCGY